MPQKAIVIFFSKTRCEYDAQKSVLKWAIRSLIVIAAINRFIASCPCLCPKQIWQLGTLRVGTVGLWTPMLRQGSLSEHEGYCGCRTEKCEECGEFIMLKNWELHVNSNHGFIKLKDGKKVHCFYVHVCFIQVTTCGAPDALTRLGMLARREYQTSFKIVTWTKQTWTKHHNTGKGGSQGTVAWDFWALDLSSVWQLQGIWWSLWISL